MIIQVSSELGTVNIDTNQTYMLRAHHTLSPHKAENETMLGALRTWNFDGICHTF